MANLPTLAAPSGQTSSDFERQLRETNEALLIASVRQHELADQAQQANAALTESEHRYHTLFDLGPVAVYSCDALGVIQDYNRFAAELWGREPAHGDTDERFCGSFRMLRPDGSYMPHAQCPMANVLSGKVPETRNAEVCIERPDGSRVTVVVNIRPLKNERSEVTGAINCFHDITARTLLEQQTKEQAQALADLHRRKDEFLAMLSHELRNPLSPILNAVQLLRLQRDRTPLQQEAHAIIERQVAQLARLVDDLLEVSRISTVRIHLREEQIDFRGVVNRAIETTQPQMEQKGQSLAKSLPAEPIWVYGDPMRLEQVVVNLLNNASKYTERGGHIWVELDQDEDAAVLRVRDDGIGIAPAMLPRIFELFAQADKSLDRSQGGLGIGLALVRSLVNMHRGSVNAQSTLGQGSEFTVKLPVHLSPQRTIAPPIEIVATPARALRLLVVDDNKDAARSLANLLRAVGHEALVAFEGTSAMQAALESVPDIVLLDIGLPVMNGYEIAKWFRQQPTLKHVVLIALTGYGQQSDRQRSQEAGFDHHLVKPVDFATIETILSAVAGKPQ